MISRLGHLVGDPLRRVRSRSGNDHAGSKNLMIVIILTAIVSSSIIVRSAATGGSSSISANCDECHAPSIYLIVEIRFTDTPTMIVRNESTSVNVTVEVSSSHKSYVWSGFGMDVWLSPGTDHTSCGPHQIINGQKPHGQSPPYSWTETFSFNIISSLVGNETFTVNARMSPIHESPPVTAMDQFSIPIVKDKNATFPSESREPTNDNIGSPSSDSRAQRLGPVGLTIVLIGGLAVLAGLFYVVYTLIKPVERMRKRADDDGGQII